MARLSAFADEVTDDFLGQVQYLASEHISFIELRFINGKNVLVLNQSELKQAKQMLNDHGIAVSAIGSPIGKVTIDKPFAPHLDRFKHTIDIAQFFNSQLIRVFSYYPPDGKNIQDYRQEIIDRMSAKVELIRDIDLVMVHENEAGIYGHTAANCIDLVQTINSPELRLAYDPANFVWGEKIVDNITTCWPMMKPYVIHIHIKDWKLGANTGSIPGQGDGQITELLSELAQMDYNGFLTMEPHLQIGGQFGGKTGPDLFSKAVSAVRHLAEKTGLNCD